MLFQLVLGVALKNTFTDDTNRVGPDHGFAVTPKNLEDMVEQSTSALASLGSGDKKVEKTNMNPVSCREGVLGAGNKLDQKFNIEKE